MVGLTTPLPPLPPSFFSSLPVRATTSNLSQRFLQDRLLRTAEGALQNRSWRILAAAAFTLFITAVLAALWVKTRRVSPSSPSSVAPHRSPATSPMINTDPTGEYFLASDQQIREKLQRLLPYPNPGAPLTDIDRRMYAFYLDLQVHCEDLGGGKAEFTLQDERRYEGRATNFSAVARTPFEHTMKRFLQIWAIERNKENILYTTNWKGERVLRSEPSARRHGDMVDQIRRFSFFGWSDATGYPLPTIQSLAPTLLLCYEEAKKHDIQGARRSIFLGFCSTLTTEYPPCMQAQFDKLTRTLSCLDPNTYAFPGTDISKNPWDCTPEEFLSLILGAFRDVQVMKYGLKQYGFAKMLQWMLYKWNTHKARLMEEPEFQSYLSREEFLTYIRDRYGDPDTEDRRFQIKVKKGECITPDNVAPLLATVESWGIDVPK